MSDYDLQNTSKRGRGAMDYAGERSGSGVWAVVGVVAIVIFIAALVIGGGGGFGDGTATTPAGADGTVAPAMDTAPAAPAAPAPPVGTDTN